MNVRYFQVVTLPGHHSLRIKSSDFVKSHQNLNINAKHKQEQLNPAISNPHGKRKIVPKSGSSKHVIVNDSRANPRKMILK